MPAVEDFPPVAQREYWAKASDTGAPAGRSRHNAHHEIRYTAASAGTSAKTYRRGPRQASGVKIGAIKTPPTTAMAQVRMVPTNKLICRCFSDATSGRDGKHGGAAAAKR